MHKALREENLIGFVNSDDEVPGTICFIKKEKEPKKMKKSKKDVIETQSAPPLTVAEKKLIYEINK